MKTKHLIEKEHTILEALSQLNTVRPEFTLFVIDKDRAVIGSVTGGDIRRGLTLQGCVLSDSVHKCMCRDFIFVREAGSYSQRIKDAQVKGIRLIPVLDNEGRLIELLDLTVTRRRSPIDTMVMSQSHDWGNAEVDLKVRKARHDVINWKNQLRRFSALAIIPSTEFEFLLERERLDEFYTALVRGIDWIEQLRTLRAHDQKLKRTIELLEHKKAEVLNYYATYFHGAGCCGDSEVLDNPDFVFVLGSENKEESIHRVTAALEVLKQNDSSRLILSGGGGHPKLSEARQMKLYLDAAGPVAGNRIILEEDSLDTVGNAVFGRLTLMMRGLLKDEESANICVVTSAYHAVRSLSIFRRVFSQRQFGASPRVKVSVLPVTIYDDGQAAKRAKIQLDGESEVNRTSFAMPNYLSGDVRRIDHGEVGSIFYQMMTRHHLYRFRYDLIRKFSSALEE